MNLAPQAAYNLIRDAGFTPTQCALPLAISERESAFDPYAIGVNHGENPTFDRGIVQWNNYWHPEVTNEMAFTPALAYREMYRLSKGVDFSAWTTLQSAQPLVDKYNKMIADGGWEAAYQASKVPAPLDPRDVTLSIHSAIFGVIGAFAAGRWIARHSDDKKAVRIVSASGVDMTDWIKLTP